MNDLQSKAKMPSTAFIAAGSIILLLPVALAQSPVWGQCGGTGWTGATTCVSGSVCTYSNPWYSQCIPGTATTAPTSTPPTSTPTSTPTSSTPTPTPTGGSGSKGPNFWFSFGDSYTTTGFNANGALPNSANPIGNPAYPGTTDGGGGANWVDYVTTQYNRSQVFLYNFAVGGSTIDRNLVSPPGGTTVTDQVNTFLNLFGSKPAKTPWTSDNALFSIFIGINDIASTYSNSGDRGAFSDQLLAAEFALVQKLYNVGARNFLFVNVPPMDRSPQVISWGPGAVSGEKTVIAGFNSRLATKVSQFAASNSGVKTYFWDSNAQFTTILNNPTAYGFKDATSYGAGQSNIFWGNAYHPSTYAHKYFGQNVGQNVLGSTIW